MPKDDLIETSLISEHKRVTKEDIAAVMANTFYEPIELMLSSSSIDEVVHQSIDKVELVCALEEYYNITLSLEEALHLSDWDTAIAYLQAKVDLANKKNEA